MHFVSLSFTDESEVPRNEKTLVPEKFNIVTTFFNRAALKIIKKLSGIFAAVFEMQGESTSNDQFLDLLVIQAASTVTKSFHPRGSLLES